MLDKPQIVQTTAQITAAIHLTVPREDIQNVMGPAIGELMAAVQAQGISPIGPLLSYHLKRPCEVFDFEISVPVSKPVTAVGRVKPGQLPAAKVARTVYRGPYEGLGEAWGEFMGWIATQGLPERDDLWECYLKGPESGDDPAKWETELNRPLKG